MREGEEREWKPYLKLDVVYRWGGDHTVERGESMLIANLLAVQLKLRLMHLSVHVQSDHGLEEEIVEENGRIIPQFAKNW